MKRFSGMALAVALLASLINPVQSHAVSSNPTAICVGSTCTISFPFSGDYYAWTVPSSGNYDLEVWGAQGGTAAYNTTVYTNGGKGGYAKGSTTLTAGQILNIYVGGQGGGASSTSTNAFLAGGYNGGGTGYNGNSTNDYRGGGGGGATDIRLSGTALTDRIIVAGGGGGGSYYSGYGTVFYPGVGGGTTGGDGYSNSFNAASGWHGKGGTQSAGGAAGAANGGGNPGALGLGGASVSSTMGCAGGGGGYYGGGSAGPGMASGGGSGYVGSLTSTTLTAGTSSMPDPVSGTTIGRSGNGFARITYTASNATISMSLAGGVTKVFKGESVAITATVDYAGKVTFYADGKKIAGCVAMQASVGNKICYWKPTIQKSVKLTAKIEPNGATGATTTLLNISVVKRTGLRT